MAVNWNVCAIHNAITFLLKVIQIETVLFILLISLYWSSVTGCAITNVTHLSEETNSVSLNWDLSLDCPDNPGPFQMLAKHKKYLACNDRIKGPETRLIANQVSIHNICKLQFDSWVFSSSFPWAQRGRFGWVGLGLMRDMPAGPCEAWIWCMGKGLIQCGERLFLGF